MCDDDLDLLVSVSLGTGSSKSISKIATANVKNMTH